MADLFLDTFTGSGPLLNHVSDSGSPWTDAYTNWPIADNVVGGGYLRTGAPSHSGGGQTTVIAPYTCSVEIVMLIGNLTSAGFTFDHQFGNSTASIQADNTTFYLDAGIPGTSLIYVPYSPGLHTFRIDITPTQREWFFDGVSVGLNVGVAVSPYYNLAPYGFILDNSADGLDSNFGIDSLRIFTAGAPPAFWTGNVLTTEVDA